MNNENKLLNYLNIATNGGDIDIAYIRKMSYQNDFRFAYEKNNNKRIIFYTDRSIIKPIHKICNGVIFELIDGEWRCVCVPLPVFKRYNCNQLIDLDKRLIVQAHDATIVNVYYSYYYEQWQISTKRCMDICDRTWRGVSYDEVLNDVKMEFSKLDKNFTYVYALRDPRIHMFKPEKVIYPVARCSIDKIERYDEPIDINATMIKQLCTDSIYNLDNPCYGFIAYMPGEYEVEYYIESSLMKKIRETLYMPTIVRDMDKKIDQNVIKLINDNNYMIVRSFFNNRKDAELMFPTFNDTFRRVNNIINGCVNYCIKKINNIDYDDRDELSAYQLFWDSNYQYLRNLQPDDKLFNKIKNFIFTNKNKNIELFSSLL